MYKRGIKILFPFLIINVISLLMACNTTIKEDLYDNDPPKLGELSTQYYTQLGITEDVRKSALAVMETFQTTSGKELQIRLPEYWKDIYYLEIQTMEPDSKVTFEAFIDLYDKYNYDLRDGGGLLCNINVYKLNDFNHNFNPHIPEAYDQVIGANSSIIGTDDQYVYLLWLPTDVQFVYEDELATVLYQNGMQAKDKIINDFLLVNEITVNEKAPVLN